MSHVIRPKRVSPTLEGITSFDYYPMIPICDPLGMVPGWTVLDLPGSPYPTFLDCVINHVIGPNVVNFGIPGIITFFVSYSHESTRIIGCGSWRSRARLAMFMRLNRRRVSY